MNLIDNLDRIVDGLAFRKAKIACNPAAVLLGQKRGGNLTGDEPDRSAGSREEKKRKKRAANEEADELQVAATAYIECPVERSEKNSTLVGIRFLKQIRAENRR